VELPGLATECFVLFMAVVKGTSRLGFVTNVECFMTELGLAATHRDRLVNYTCLSGTRPAWIDGLDFPLAVTAVVFDSAVKSLFIYARMVGL